MAKKQETQAEGNVLSQYAALKQKHPDAMLMFRQGDFYELFKEDAVKAAVILALNVSEKILPQEKNRSRRCHSHTTPWTSTCPNSSAQNTASPSATG